MGIVTFFKQCLINSLFIYFNKFSKLTLNSIKQIRVSTAQFSLLSPTPRFSFFCPLLLLLVVCGAAREGRRKRQTDQSKGSARWGQGVKGRLAAWVMESQDRVAAADIPLSFYRKATANRVESLNSNREMGARLESEDKVTTIEVLLLLSIVILRLERCPYQYPVLNLIPGLNTPLVLIKCAPVLQNWHHATYTTYRYYPKNWITK